MYKITKDPYSVSNVFITNTETASLLNLGKVTVEMLSILHKSGIDTTPSRNWAYIISKETADELARTAMRMKKPVRKKAEQKVEYPQPPIEKTPKPKKQPVDVFNLIFGIEED